MTPVTAMPHTKVCRDELIVRAYRSMYGALCGYVAKRIGYQADVEDIVQDTFESLMKPELMLSEQSLAMKTGEG